jgi:hypothetical protein
VLKRQKEKFLEVGNHDYIVAAGSRRNHYSQARGMRNIMQMKQLACALAETISKQAAHRSARRREFPSECILVRLYTPPRPSLV